MNKNEMFQQITVNANEIYQLDFLQVAVLSYSAKGAMTADPFVKEPCLWSSIIKKSAKLKDLRNCCKHW